MRRPLLIASLMLLCQMLMSQARAAELKLVPADTRIGLTVYAMGMFAQSGHFETFTGVLQFEPGQPDSCHVAMKVEVASLSMLTETGTRLALGPSVLDAAHYPSLTYEGDCKPASTTGKLTLHGVTRPLALTTTRDANRITARGTLHRQDYAIRGLAGLIGSTINIVFSVDLPPDLAEELPR